METDAEARYRLAGELLIAHGTIEAIKLWMEETWDNMNVAYHMDKKRRAHPRWELRRILQSSKPKVINSED